MVAIKYIGRPAKFYGKRLFAILGNLQNNGTGRIVYRDSFASKFNELCYTIVTSCVPDFSDPALAKGIAHGVTIYRGENRGIQEIADACEPDWWLVPVHEEQTFLSSKPHIPPSKIALKDKVMLHEISPLLDNMFKHQHALKHSLHPTLNKTSSEHAYSSPELLLDFNSHEVVGESQILQERTRIS